MRVSTVFCVSFLVSFSVNASIWHVSPKPLPSVSRSDQFRTIQEAANKVRPGDTVLIGSGVYRETVVIEKSGTREKPIRFEAVPGANVVVTGLDPLGKWHKEDGNVYSAKWQYRFIPWSKTDAHPDDEYHRLIGRAEQVVMNGSLLHQTLELDQLSPGTFYVDLANKRLYICAPNGENLTSKNVQVEAATRSLLWECKGDYVALRGIHFRYAANPAQKDGVVFRGRRDVAEDCSFERMNGAGAAFVGADQVARRCTFQDNGQLGFTVNQARNFLLADCTVRNNNIKGFNTEWEAGGTKVVLSRGVVFDHSRFVANHGPGAWFDIGNESCTVCNCLIADNDDAGIFYEISYGLNAHDNVIVGNGFATDPNAWGGQAGIVISSSPNCVVTRNLLVGNREGFNFREQSRTTPRIDSPNEKHEEAIWNHDERICNNVIAYNRDAQTRGWFDVTDQRHWPGKLQTPASSISLEALGIVMAQNVYAREENQPMFIWGAEWRRHQNYQTIDAIQSELNLENGSQLVDLKFVGPAKRDLRLPQESPAFEMKCYPVGDVPDVHLGKLK
jgi:parallel beta helix pectate lyase-like protein